MIIKASARAKGAKDLADHLMNAADNEQVRIVEFVGTMATTLLEAFRDFEAVASGSRSQRPYYHASISPERPLTPGQLERAVDALGAKLGLDGHPRVVVEHVKDGREHCHVVWQRYDLERGRMAEYGHNYRKHEEVARQLEQEFGHTRTVGAHVRDKAREPRPGRTPGHPELQQAKRLGTDSKQMKAELSALWAEAETGAQFKAIIEARGYHLARGERRDFVIVDAHGGVHSLARRLEQTTVADVRRKFADLDRAGLPSVAEVRERMAQNQEAGLNSPMASVMARSASEGEGARQRSDAKVGVDIGRRAEGAAADVIAKPIEKAIEVLADLVTEMLAPSAPPTEQEVKAAIAAREEAAKPKPVWEMSPAELHRLARERESKSCNEQLERGTDPRLLDDGGERQSERPRERPKERGRE